MPAQDVLLSVYIDWMAKDDDDDPEVWMVEPAYRDGMCNNYYQRLYYGG